jgi:Ni/Co efflux regulator RcnB
MEKKKALLITTTTTCTVQATICMKADTDTERARERESARARERERERERESARERARERKRAREKENLEHMFLLLFPQNLCKKTGRQEQGFRSEIFSWRQLQASATRVPIFQCPDISGRQYVNGLHMPHAASDKELHIQQGP